MKDGLYRVTTRYLCAGFVICRGHLAECAPILKRRIDYWMTVATLTKEDIMEAQDYKKMIQELLNLEDGLSDWEVQFVEDLKGRDQEDFTPKQRDKLEQIWQKNFK